MRRKEKKLVRANENSSKTKKLPTARENAGDQVLIDSSFASDWLGEWREFLDQSQHEVKRNRYDLR